MVIDVLQSGKLYIARKHNKPKNKLIGPRRLPRAYFLYYLSNVSCHSFTNSGSSVGINSSNTGTSITPIISASIPNTSRQKIIFSINFLKRCISFVSPLF